MIALIQRVTDARVVVEQRLVGEIQQGILALIGVEKADTTQNADRLLERLLGYRIFSDSDEKMNFSLSDIGGGLLVVPQFTLAADTRKGKRPSFSTAADPVKGKQLFEYFIKQSYVISKNMNPQIQIATGIFGADMKVSLCNDGPVTFWISA